MEPKRWPIYCMAACLALGLALPSAGQFTGKMLGLNDKIGGGLLLVLLGYLALVVGFMFSLIAAPMYFRLNRLALVIPLVYLILGRSVLATLEFLAPLIMRL